MKFLIAFLFCTAYSVNAQMQTTNDESSIDAGLKQWRLMIPGDTITVPGSAMGFKDPVKISDIGTMKRTGHTQSQFSKNDLRFTGSFGFTDLKVEGVTMKSGDDLVTLGGAKLDKATITSPDNSFDVEYEAKVQQEGCMINWVKFKVTKMEGVKVNGGDDVTKEFNEKVLPTLNENLNGDEFLGLLKEHMTPCKETPLRKLFWGV